MTVLGALAVLGGNGHTTGYQVKQLTSEASVLRIYPDTEEIEISRDASNLLS